MTGGGWEMSSDDPLDGAGTGTWRARVETSGAVRFAPRELSCWFAGNDLAVRDDHGRLLWLAVGRTTVCRDAVRGLVESHEEAPDTGLIRHPASEAVALQGPGAALAWLGVGAPYDGTRGDGVYLGRAVHRVLLEGNQFDAIEILTDHETGHVLGITAEHREHGPLGVLVTTFVRETSERSPFELTPDDRT